MSRQDETREDRVFIFGENALTLMDDEIVDACDVLEAIRAEAVDLDLATLNEDGYFRKVAS